jgi:LytS/YehU family sensor histidine kinase
VPLAQELEHVKNYIELEEIRQGDTVEIKKDLITPTEEYFIAPFILIQFVENAFKHVSHYPDQKNFISIALEKNHDELIFIVENSKWKDSDVPKNKPGGIGSVNVKRRLDLVYPESYSLETKDIDNTYSTTLKLSLNELSNR